MEFTKIAKKRCLTSDKDRSRLSNEVNRSIGDGCESCRKGPSIIDMSEEESNKEVSSDHSNDVIPEP